MYYDCTVITPTVEITNVDFSVGVGETGQLTTTNSDVYGGDVVSYAWSSDDTSVATVSGNTASATVTGVAAGTANITVTMTVNGTDYTDTLGISVTAAAATVKEMTILDTSFIQGAGIFCRFNPSSQSVTAAQLDTFTSSVDVSFVNDGVSNAVNHYTLQDKGDTSYTAYVVMDSAVGLNGQFTVTADFKDMVNNIIYRAAAHFDSNELAPEIKLTAAGFSVEAGDTLEITASKAYYLEGEPTFSFTSLDTDVFTVSGNGAVATVTGVAEGTAALRVTMTIGGDNYVIEKNITVSAAGVQHLIPWYTEGTGNQRNHLEGAGIWTWVKYGDLGYDGFSAFSAQKSNMTASYSTTGVRVEVISDDMAGIKVCRVYLVLNAAVDGTLTMTIPDANGVTYTGTIVFSANEAVSYNA